MITARHSRVTKSFFDKVREEVLIERMFQELGVSDLLGGRKITTPAGAWNAWQDETWLQSHVARQRIMEACDLSTEPATFTRIQAARDAGIDEEVLKELTGHRLAVTLLLDHPLVFGTAVNFFTLEKVDNLRSWTGRKPHKYVPKAGPFPELENRLCKILGRDLQGPRLLLQVEARHPNKWMAMVTHEAHVSPDLQFEEGGESTLAVDRRPLRELVIVYYPEKDHLKISANRSQKREQEIVSEFSRHVLGAPDTHFSPANYVVLDPLKSAEFKFPLLSTDPFDSAVINHVEFSPRSNQDLKFIVRDGSRGYKSVLDSLRQHSIRSEDICITRASIRFSRRRSKRTTTVTLTVPSKTTLDETEGDRIIEEILARWEILNRDFKPGKDVHA